MYVEFARHRRAMPAEQSEAGSGDSGIPWTKGVEPPPRFGPGGICTQGTASPRAPLKFSGEGQDYPKTGEGVEPPPRFGPGGIRTPISRSLPVLPKNFFFFQHFGKSDKIFYFLLPKCCWAPCTFLFLAKKKKRAAVRSRPSCPLDYRPFQINGSLFNYCCEAEFYY